MLYHLMHGQKWERTVINQPPSPSSIWRYSTHYLRTLLYDPTQNPPSIIAATVVVLEREREREREREPIILYDRNN